jgi:hypothetical protein
LTKIIISVIIYTMRKDMPANPFAASEADKAANLAQVKTHREELDEIRGTHGSDGPLVDAISKFGLRAMDRGEEISAGFEHAAEDLGVLAVTAPQTIREHRNKK